MQDKPTTLRKLHFRSHHRGSKESDVILGGYADAHLAGMSSEELELFERFLEESDQDIWDWTMGVSEPEKQEYHALIASLRAQYGADMLRS
jgi:antitoxin CptB